MAALAAAVLVPAVHGAAPATAWAASGSTVAGQAPSWGPAADQLSQPNAVAVDGSGNVYVADYDNQRVQKWVPGATSGTTVAGGNGQGSALNQLSSPRGLAFDAAGNLYVADFSNYRVLRFPPGSTSATDGTVVAGVSGSYGTDDTHLGGPSGVALDSVGNLYVSDQPLNRVQRFGWNGSSFTAAAVTIMGGNGYGTGANQLAYPGGLAIDWMGNVYVADSQNDRVQRRAGDGTVATVAGATDIQSNAANRLSGPWGVAVDASRTVFVADTGNNRVQRWALDAVTGTTVGGGNGDGTGATQIAGPMGLTLDSGGDVFVADSRNSRVQRFASGSTSATSATTVAGQAPSWGPAANRLWLPSESAVDGAGNVYVADTYNHRVQKWAPNATQGTTVAGGNGAGSGLDQLYNPSGVAVDATGRVYVADTANARVVRWAPGDVAGTVVAGGNGSGDLLTQMWDPSGVALDGTGRLYVTDPSNNQVLRFPADSTSASSGTIVAGGNGAGAGAAQLDTPMALALDATGNVYVSDLFNNRVQKWAVGATQGTTVAGGNGAGDNANQLFYPRGVAVDGTGNVYVADNVNQRVQRWAPNASSGTTIVGGNGEGGAANQLRYPYGLALSVAGNLYVTDTGNHRVQKWVGLPEAPTIGTVTPSGTSASVAFTPGDPGGSAPKYGASCTSTNGGTARQTAEAALTTSSPTTVVDLTPGGVYTCQAFAVNNAGSVGSALSSSFTVRPAAPTIGTVTPSGTSASVAFTPAAGIGAGSAFTATCASSNGGTTRSASGSASPLSVTSLTAGALYTCRATASNSGGDSPASGASSSFTPTQTGTTATAVTYSGATKVLPAGTFTLTARLTAGTKGVSGKTLWYRFGDGTASSLPTTTDRNGNTTATVSAPGPVGSYTLWVWFPGDATYRFAGVTNGTAFTVQDKQDTTVLLSSVSPGTLSNLTVTAARGSSQTFSATLTPAVAGETVNFKITQNATTLSNVNATTNGSGVASATIKVSRTAGTYTLTVSHADNTFYGLSTASYVLSLA